MAVDHQAQFQLGKNGLTEGVIESLKLYFKYHKQVRISVLKSATRDRTELKELAEKIKTEIGIRSSYKILGYTIILRKL
ncbi:YhbY family RNA-binding protein [Candidatus Pacearchaeota archaeon]|nr:YhbY family RNA-binding protein [Candidatus Pacearchaeota archaeon]